MGTSVHRVDDLGRIPFLSAVLLVLSTVLLVGGCGGDPGPEGAERTGGPLSNYHRSLAEARSLAGLRPCRTSLLRERYHAAGERRFDPAGLREADEILLGFLDALALAGDAPGRRSVFERAVRGFDGLNEKYPGFIETGEREELVAFFDRAADLVGLEYAGGDATWEWRTGW